MGYFQERQKLKLGLIHKIGPEKEKYQIPRQSEKKKQQIKDEKPEAELLEQWFIDREKEQTGVCVECGQPSTKGHPTYWKFSICHILPKKIFKSVKTHPLNYIELCHFGNSHHNNWDNNGFEWARENMPKAWKIIVERFKILFPLIATKERSQIPDALLQELEP